ncbi:MAG: hypothetical protein JWP92_1448 [Caulobacter sp.]|nr:hypothetical protein [Caulobacter sp.]
MQTLLGEKAAQLDHCSISIGRLTMRRRRIAAAGLERRAFPVTDPVGGA